MNNITFFVGDKVEILNDWQYMQFIGMVGVINAVKYLVDVDTKEKVEIMYTVEFKDGDYGIFSTDQLMIL